MPGRVIFVSLGFLLAISLAVSSAHAAQMLVIRAEKGQILANPTDEAQLLEELPRGQSLNGSNEPKNGWYRVRTVKPNSKGALGWIRAESVMPQAEWKTLNESGIQAAPVARRGEIAGPDESGWKLSLAAQSSILTGATTARNRIEFASGERATLYYLMGGLELSYLTRPGFSYSARVSYFSLSRDFPWSGKTVKLSASGAMLESWLNWFRVLNTWKVGLGLGPGVTLGTSGKVAVDSAVATTTPSYYFPLLGARMLVDWYPGGIPSSLALFFNAGYRYVFVANRFTGLPLTAAYAELGVGWHL